MGKGDKRSRKGKINVGSWGKSRPRRKKKKNAFVPKPASKPVTKPAAKEAAAPAAVKAKKPRAKKEKKAES